MNLKTTYPSGIKTRLLALVMLAGAMLNSCTKVTFVTPMNVGTIRFNASSYTIARNAGVTNIVLPLSLPLEADGTALVTIDSKSTGLSSQYTIDPAIPANGLTLNLAKGATQASFNITSLENFEGDITVVLKLSTATGGLTIANTNATTTITIQGKPIILPSLTASVPSLGFPNTNVTTVSNLSFTVTGVKLTSGVTVTAPANFKVSLDNVTFTSSVNITAAAAMAAPVTVYAQFAPNTGVNQPLGGDITLTSGSLSAVVQATGNETGNAAPGVLLLKEDFNYGATAGNLVALSGGNWTSFSGTVNPVKYVVPGLTFPGYAGSGVGGGTISDNGSGSREDDSRTIPTVTSGTIYIAQLINVSTAASGSDFFTSFRDPAAAYFNRLYVKDNAGKVNIGIAKSSATTAFSGTNYDYGTTYLVISKYDFASGISSLFVLNSTIPLIEPATPDATTSTGTGPTSLINFIIRQNTVTLTTAFDGVRVATSWKDAVGL